MSQREQVWSRLTNIKYKALYACRCSELADLYGRAYSIFVALGTAGTVAGWWVWQQYATTWALIAGIAQVLHVIKPSVPFIGTEKDHLESSYKYERLYLDFQRFWNAYERGDFDERSAEEKLHELRHRERDIDERHAGFCPDGEKLKEKIWRDTQAALRLDFPALPIVERLDSNVTSQRS